MRQAKVSPYLVGIFETFSKQFFIFRHLMFCHWCNLIKFKGSYSLKLKVNWLFLQGQQEYQLYATKWWKSHSELTRKVNLFQCSRAWDWYSYYGSIQILLDDNKYLEKNIQWNLGWFPILSNDDVDDGDDDDGGNEQRCCLALHLSSLHLILSSYVFSK